MLNQMNPFALVRASDYTDAQINNLWVELGPRVMNALIEPQSALSKYILGGRGSGKTHILRYYSYLVARLRAPRETGLAVVRNLGFFGVFLRATALDSARFEALGKGQTKWQQLFGVYLELRLAEAVLDAACDVKETSIGATFNEEGFVRAIEQLSLSDRVRDVTTIEGVRQWLIEERRGIDDAINNAAFSGRLDVRVPFSVGALCLSIKKALGRWHKIFLDAPLIYLIDEIENFSAPQQEVLNSLVRYGEGMATFRMTGRLYARKTLATIGGGEENREGAEFTTVNLDAILKSYPRYGDFARKFVLKRLGFDSAQSAGKAPDPRAHFEEVISDDFFERAISRLGLEGDSQIHVAAFRSELRDALDSGGQSQADRVVEKLVEGLPLVLAKLNCLQFCKKYRHASDPMKLADGIRRAALELRRGKGSASYSNAYGHFKADLFAQVCRESRRSVGPPYAGFDTFVKMSSGNPRNLLIVLGRAYEIAAFRELDFLDGPPLSIELQTEAALEAARFMFERDTNYGSPSDKARVATERLAIVLRTARYALNVPEVSPLAVSFADEVLTPDARTVLASCLNYSLLFEVREGRPDRNSDRVMRKIQLNPLLSPRWGLPVARRGDISLSSDLVNSIFDPRSHVEFASLLDQIYAKWNHPFTARSADLAQTALF